MQELIRQYGTTVINVITFAILMAILTSGVYFGTAGLLAGLGKANPPVSDNFNEYSNELVDTNTQTKIDINVANCPLINKLYGLTANDGGDYIFVLSKSNVPIKITKISTENCVDCIATNQVTYDSSNNQITFNEAGRYTIVVSALDASIIRRIFTITVV